MNNLPTEILHNIFLLLPLIQKQECMFVCRRWEKNIRERSLFQTVSVYNTTLYKNFIQAIEHSPAIRYQVEDLTLFECFPADHDKRKILKLFPNLRVLRLCIGDPAAIMVPYEISDDSNDQIELSSKNKIRYLDDYGQCELTLFMIKSGNCSHLTTLELNLHKLTTARTTVLPRLKNMPALRHFIISNSELTMQDCEMLHANLPSMEIFKLKKVTYLSNASLPTVSVPASTITHLDMNMIRLPLKDHLDWIHYITIKYPNLKYLDYWYHCSEESEAKQFHNDGYGPLIQTLGRKLKRLNISNLYDDTTIKKLDDSGCQITSLNLQSYNPDLITKSLSRSNQAKCLERLAVVGNKPINFKWLKKMKSLKSLELFYLNMNSNNIFHLEFEVFFNIRKYLTLDLCEFFKSCSDTLEQVCITSTYAEFNPRARRKFPSIKILELDEVKTPRGIDKFISKCFPNLHSLTLINCIEDDAQLSFPSHHFSHLEIMALDGYSDGGTNIKLITSNNARPRFYSGGYKKSRRGYTQLDRHPGPISVEDILFENFVTITCASVKELVIDHLTMFTPSDNSEFKI